MTGIRWGILSTANIGRVAVVPAIQASSNGEVVAVASRDRSKLEAFADQAGIPRRHHGYQALLEDPQVDAIYLPLPNSLHREWTILAAQRGKHVLCEKPIALTAAECEEMDRIAAANRVKAMEAFMYRFHPRTARVVELVGSGAIGEPRFIRSAFTFRLSRPDNIRLVSALGGGALMDVGCYCVNLSRTVAAAEPEAVEAWANWGPTGVDVELTGSIQFPNGLIAQFDCALTTERREWYEVAGTEATLRVESAFLPGTGTTIIEERRGRADPVTHQITGTDEYREMVEHFADAILHDRPLRYPLAEAAANMRVIEALYRSARDGGRPVKV
jgi:predicted dehydrogenase